MICDGQRVTVFLLPSKNSPLGAGFHHGNGYSTHNLTKLTRILGQSSATLRFSL
jgi:hypothetical protein